MLSLFLALLLVEVFIIQSSVGSDCVGGALSVPSAALHMEANQFSFAPSVS